MENLEQVLRLQKEKEPIVMDILRILSEPTEDFYRICYPEDYSADTPGTNTFYVRTPLLDVWYKRASTDDGRVIHTIGNDIREVRLVRLGGSEEVLGAYKDVFEDEELRVLYNFAKTIEEEWKTFQPD